MLIFKQIAQLRAFLLHKKAEGKTIGFVPTMGALHPGHVSLIALSKKQCDITVCSIFVNPTQFNDKKDLERYPRMPEKDAKLLEKADCDVLFIPSVEEIYPEAVKEAFEFGYLNTILEGRFRPGHFNGVAQVVKRFFTIVEPDKAFFGSKDYQQVMIIKALVKLMRSPIEIVPCPILREPDGLAMSSRNALLNAEERQAARLLPAFMQEANGIIISKGIAAAKEFIKQQTAANALMKLDYYEVCEADTLEIVSGMRPGVTYVALIACFVGRIRLIDNLPVDAGR
jgi:pantoate--beta-alanine ligase